MGQLSADVFDGRHHQRCHASQPALGNGALACLAWSTRGLSGTVVSSSPRLTFATKPEPNFVGAAWSAIAGTHQPRARWPPDTVFALVRRQRLVQRCDHGIRALRSFFPCETHDLAGGAERHRELHRLVEIPADADVGVETLERDAVSY